MIKKDKGPLSLGVQMKTFFNTYIRQGTAIANTSKLANNFEVYFRNRLKKEIDSKKTPAAKQKYKEILEAGMKILRPNRDGLYFTIATYITLQTAKSLLLGKLNQIQSIGSFLRTKNGYKVTNPEGYVAIKRGGAVKLVDRLEFSRANFTMAKDWVKG
jgi:phosphorylcholine metabolism protein LicD